MIRRSIVAKVVALTSFGLLSCIASTVHAQNSSIVPGEVLVGLLPEMDRAVQPQTLSTLGRVVETQPTLHTLRLQLNPSQSVESAIATLRKQPGVMYAEPNHLLHVTSTTNDPYIGDQWSIPTIQADKAWAQWRPLQNVVVAIVDTGVDSTHPDLVHQMYRDSSGIVGYNAFTQQRDIAMDVYGHGTHCAGIVAAQVDNGIGVAGIAGVTTNFALNPTASTASPLGFGISIMPVRVMDNTGSGTDATVSAGIVWAADHGARVISLSLGGPDDSTTMDNACAYAWSKGCILVAAAGNSGVSTKFYPAACANVLSVAASNSSDTLASFSNWGNWVSVAAPGDTILSTLPTYQVQPTWPLNYAYMSGTSMAAPHVSAEAALLLAAYPHLSNSQTNSLIVQNVDPCASASGHTLAVGVGRINLLRALTSASELPTPPPAPTGLTAQAANGAAVLNWKSSTTAQYYNVLRATQAAGPFSVVTSALPFITFTDRSVAAGTTYYYAVLAENGAGMSPDSNVVSVSIPGAPKMAAPSGLTGVANAGHNDLTWHLPPTATNKTPIRVYRATGTSGSFTLLQTVTGGTQFSDTQVVGGINYTYFVTAIDTTGQETPHSNSVTVTAKSGATRMFQ